ncbi:MAG: TatD family hydrolase [Janthinobacterium lividum]
MTEFTDTHCHLNHEDFTQDWQEARDRADAVGVTRLLCIGYDRASSRRATEIAAQNAGIYAAIGIHPESAAEWSAETLEEMAALYTSSADKVAAYGEIGLDYHWETVPHEQQREVFAAQIAFAQTLRPTLPLIIHNRDALEDVLAVLKTSQTPAPIVMHCFTGNTDAARLCLDAGCYLGIGGVATFKKSEAVREAIAYAPMERLLLETDCPYLAPQFKRGRRNEPSYLPAVAETVAAVKNLSLEEVATVTTATAKSLFGMM